MANTATADPASVSGRSNTKRNIVIGILVILFIMLGFLIYYYLDIMRPKTSPDKPVLKDYGFIRAIFGPSANEPFKSLIGANIDANKNIYVTDPIRGKIDIFDRNGNYSRSIGEKGDGDKQLSKPYGVAIDANGDIYVADESNHKIIVFDKDGKYLRNWGVMMPHFVEIFDKKIHVSTYGPFYVYDKTGKVLMKWGKKGRKNTELDTAYGIVPGNDNIYIADTMNSRVLSLKRNGDIDWSIGKPNFKMTADASSEFQVPLGLTEDENGVLYVADSLSFAISAITKKGKLIEKFGKDGSREGEFLYPSGLKYQGNRRFIVVDKGNNRVQIVEIPVTSKMVKAIEKETGNKISVTKLSTDSLWNRLLRFLGLS